MRPKNRTIYLGDVLEKLRELPGESIDVMVTSPPYWALRDYKAEGQWGLEPDFREYLKKMDLFMAEIKRVLKKTGTVWVNLGDTYSGGTAHSDWAKDGNTYGKFCYSAERVQEQGFDTTLKKNQIAAKSRYGIPERFYINCIDNGWLARNHIPWVKPNAMPSSVRDRLSNKWESIFFFAKHQKYYFNLNAIREKPKTELPKPKKKLHKIEGQKTLAPTTDQLSSPYGLRVEGQSPQGIHRNREQGLKDWGNKQDTTLGADGQPNPTYAGFNDRWNESGGVSGKNPGDVFVINAKPFAEAHFATFPLELPLTILKAAAPKEVCSNCGMPRFPIVEPSEQYKKYLGKGWHDHKNDLEQGMQQEKEIPNLVADYRITGWTKCDCNEAFLPGLVLDPFFGAGTTAVAAESLGLDWVGIELKPEYVSDIVKKRLHKHNNKRLNEFA